MSFGSLIRRGWGECCECGSKKVFLFNKKQTNVLLQLNQFKSLKQSKFSYSCNWRSLMWKDPGRIIYTSPDSTNQCSGSITFWTFDKDPDPRISTVDYGFSSFFGGFPNVNKFFYFYISYRRLFSSVLKDKKFEDFIQYIFILLIDGRSGINVNNKGSGNSKNLRIIGSLKLL